MSDLAHTLVQACQKTRATYLDLGNCGLTDLNQIPELFTCTQLEILILSHAWEETDHGELVEKKSRNPGPPNHLSALSPSLSKLPRLKKLVCAGSPANFWSISTVDALAGLTQLRSLDLSYNQICDVGGLSQLGELVFLQLSSNLISDIRPLAGLSALQFLYLRHNQISDINSLAALVHLQSLQLTDNQISDINSLSKLSTLQHLDISFNQLSDIRALADLTELKSLDVSNNEISSLGDLGKVQFLQNLDLSFNQLSDIGTLAGLDRLQDLALGDNQLSDIRPLAHLNRLQSLNLRGNFLTDISALAGLSNLQSLDIRDNRISGIDALHDLSTLQSLDLSNNQVSSIQALRKLSRMAAVDLSFNPITNLDALPELVRFPKLQHLSLYGIQENNLRIPPEQFGQDYGDNCLENLRGYFASVQKGATRTREVPVILVGNSTAGKTSLLEFIRYHRFPPQQDYSTHGIVPAVWVPEQTTLDQGVSFPADQSLQFYFWDFGGQEYYHATHRLFFNQHAIYLLLWEQKTNLQGIKNTEIRVKKPNGEIEDKIQPVALFPCTFWLQTIRSLAKEFDQAPVVMIQNKLDIEGNEKKDHPGDDFRKEYGISEVFHLSIKEAFNTHPEGLFYQEYERFLQHLFDLADSHFETFDRQMYWQEIKAVINRRKKENIWSRDEFLRELQRLDADIDESGMMSYIRSLRAMGFIIYYPDDDYLKEFVFINPEWVMEHIYGILDHSVLHNAGEFTRAKVIQQLGTTYTPLFIALMKEFELIFERKTDTYIAPQYLPSTPQNEEALVLGKAALPDNGATASLIIEFADFMPPNIMQRLIATYGDKAIGQVYWKYGVFCRLAKNVLIESNPDQRQLCVKVQNHDEGVVWDLYQALNGKVGHEQISEHFLSLDNGANFINIAEIQEQLQAGNANAISRAGVSCPLAPYKFLFGHRPEPDNPRPDTKKTIKVFISYAHDDDVYFQTFAEELNEHLRNPSRYHFEAFEDRKLLVGSDWHARLQQEVDACDAGILLLSAAFFNSQYIQDQELGVMLEHMETKANFLLVPIYFKSFDFEAFPLITRYQLFKPDGSQYGHPDKKNNLCYADLVDFEFSNGKFIPKPDNDRERYMLNLRKALLQALDDKYALPV